MVRPCSRHGKTVNVCIVVVGRHEGKITLGRERYWWDVITKVDLQKTG
jgi:hypothetical protein